HRMVGQGMREDIVVSNHGPEPAGLDIVLHIDADFADLFEVKERRPVRPLEVTDYAGLDSVQFRIAANSPEERGVRVSASGAHASPGTLGFRAVVPAHGEWRASAEAVPVLSGREMPAPFPLDSPLDATEPALRLR